MCGLDFVCHVGNLVSDDGMVNQLLSKCLSLMCVFDGFLETDTSKAISLDGNPHSITILVSRGNLHNKLPIIIPLVVEVEHDVLESLVFLANQILNRDLDIFKDNVRCSRAPNTRAIHLPCRDSGHGPLNYEEGDTTHAVAAGADSNGEIVGKHTVCDPFLRLSVSTAIKGKIKCKKEQQTFSPLTM